ncbi:MAG: hypothetical protein J6S21_05915 [Victivallales bacterium]|nr:hypothetical protein [Victivallales bacterium]
MKKQITALLLLAAVLLAFAGEPDWRNTKMMWAHYVGWGFNHVAGFDENWKEPGWSTRPFTDRALYGRHLQDDTGIYESAARQIRSAMEFGFDGFCIDLFGNFAAGMARFFDGARGTPFKIALCVDGGFSREKLIQELETFIRKFGDHPNACRIDGKMVIFVYTLAVPLEDWKAVLAELDKRGAKAFYLAKPMHESRLWDTDEPIRKYLEVFDGIYDFGCNGFFYNEQKLRHANVYKAIKAKRPDALFCAGITPGYLGHTSGFYRPFMNSGTLRDNWNTAIESDAQWVCITTWNDYIEHTHFEPSSMNRTALARLNREYMWQWRGVDAPARQPLPVITYHEEVVMGADFTVDAVCGPYTTKPMTLRGRLLDLSGKVIKELKPFTPDAAKIDVAQWRVTGEELAGLRDGFRMQWALTAEGATDYWMEFQPVAIRYGHMGTLRPMRVAWDEVTATKPVLSLQRRDGKLFADVTVHAWQYAGTIEVFRNGWPVAHKEVSFQKAPVHKFSLPIEAKPAFGEDFYFVRISGVSDKVSYSAPVILRELAEKGPVSQPVIFTGSDLDENWPIWSRRISRNKAGYVKWLEMDRSKLMDVAYDFSKVTAAAGYIDALGWSFPCNLGARHWNWFSSDENTRPKSVETAGPDGKPTRAMRFDGKTDTIAMPSRTMPYGAYTLEMVIKPEGSFQDTFLFCDQNEGAILTINTQGKVRLGRLKNKAAVSSTALADGKWYHIAAVYDGASLNLYINGRKEASVPAAAETIDINSLPNIGSTSRLEKSFSGLVKSFRLAAGVTAPENFKFR